jgi:tellurite resistance protein
MEDKSILAAVARTLESEFYAKEDERLLEKLRKREKREALRELVQVEDDAFLERLIELGISPETVLALTLVPLTAVAWADGKLEDREREAITRAAEENGISQGTAEYQLLEKWLSHRPDQELFESWKRYVRGIWETFDDEERRQMRKMTLDRALAVAESAGGFLELTSKVSASERAVIEELENVLRVS